MKPLETAKSSIHGANDISLAVPRERKSAKNTGIHI
jgi:hypothetical protein